MADWESLSHSPQKNGDVMSLFTTKTASPLYRMNGHISELSFASPIKGTSDDLPSSDAFCQQHNIDQCASSINQEITTLGMSSLYADDSSTFDTVRLLNCTYELLQKHRQSSRIREELENREHRTKADIDHLKQCQQKLKFSLEQNERDLAQQQEKERQLANKNKLLTAKLKAQKEEVTKLHSSIRHMDAQYKHEVKKKERELIKLKERIHVLLTDKTEKRIGLELSDPLIRLDGKRGTWNTGNRQEEELYRGMISALEDRQSHLVVENTELRQCLKFMQQELCATLAHTSHAATNSYSNTKSELSDREKTEDLTENEDDASDADVLSEAHYEMPFDVVRDDIHKSVKETVKQIQKRFAARELKDCALSESSDSLSKTDSALGATASIDSNQVLVNRTSLPQHRLNDDRVPHAVHINEDKQREEMEKLRKQITRYKDIIEQQETLIQSQLDINSSKLDNENTSILQNSGVWDEKQQLETKQKLFDEQQANFEQERKNVAETALRLAQERKKFEQERTERLAQEFFNLTPFREASKSAEMPPSNEESPRIKQPSFDHVSPTGSDTTSAIVISSGKELQNGNGAVSVNGSVSGQDDTSGKTVIPVSSSPDSSFENDIIKVKEQQQKARSRRLLPATPSSTPDLNSTKHDLPLATPRVMARPHSSIAIADGVGVSSFVPRVLRPRSSAPSTAELYKKLGLEPPKDRGRSGEPPRMAKLHTHEAMERYPRSEPTHGTPALPTRNRPHERRNLSSSTDEGPVSPTFNVQFPLSKSQEGEFSADKTVLSNSVSDSGGHVTHVEPGFKIDLPSDTSSSADVDDLNRARRISNQELPDNDINTRKTRVTPKLGQKYADRKQNYVYKYKREKSRDEFRPNRNYTPEYPRRDSTEEVKSAENKHFYRSNRFTDDARINTSRDDVRRLSTSRDHLDRSRDELVRSHDKVDGSHDQMRAREDHGDRLRRDYTRASRSRDNLDVSPRDRTGSRKTDPAQPREEISHSDSSRDKLSRSDRSREERLNHPPAEHSRSDKSRDDNVEGERRRTHRRSSRERGARDKDSSLGKHALRGRESPSRGRESPSRGRESPSRGRESPSRGRESPSRGRDGALDSSRREYKREHSREKPRESSRERHHGRESKHSEQSGKPTRPRSRERSAERSRRHALRERPKTARDSYFNREGSFSARDHERGKSSLRRQASFEGFSLRDREGRARTESVDSRDSESSSRGKPHDRASIEYYLRRQSGGNYPVAALILRNPEKVDTYTKSSKRNDR